MKISIMTTSYVFQWLLFSSVVYSLPCILRDYPHGSVCVCNVTYCDTLEAIHPKEVSEFILVSSSKGGLRYSVTNGKFTLNNAHEKNYNVWKDFIPEVILRLRSKRFFNINTSAIFSKSVNIEIDRNITYQNIVGFGGALTGTVSYNLDKISNKLTNDIYESYFSKTVGISYNMLRITIGGSDFDLAPWAYNESPTHEKHLSNFTKLDKRDEKKIEQIKKLMYVSNNYDVKLFGSAWSSPPWMKNNNDWTGASHLLPDYYQTWADYHIRFLELMDAKNMPLWAISTGNEPSNGVIGWLFVHFMSLGWTPENQAKWVTENLGPSLRNSKFKNVKLFANDDQRYTFPSWFKTMDRTYPNSSDYLDGLAVHWYWDHLFPPTLLDEVHNLYNKKIILNTESCIGDKPFETHGPELGSWDRAEKYIKSYIEDLQHWVNGWIDWNLILDEQGGPNYVNNFVDAPIIINATSGNEIYKQPIFYAIGHFSKYLEPESVRIEAKSSDNSNVKTVAFKRPDEKIVVIVFNNRRTVVDLTILDNLRGNIVIEISPNSVHTFLYN